VEAGGPRDGEERSGRPGREAEGHDRLESGGFRSGALRVLVAPLVQLSAGADGVSVSGLARPVLPGAAVQVQRLGSNGWATAAQTTIASNGSFSAPLALSPGSYRARVVAGHGFGVGLSRTVVVP
jgi:hypothetical protein